MKGPGISGQSNFFKKNKMFTKAIVRKPCLSFKNGITTSNLGIPDYSVAIEQHKKYCEALESLGLNINILPPDDRFPDSTFIEDVAVCTSAFAVVTNPGAPARNGETEGMDEVLRGYFDNIEKIMYPGTLEGGDVMMAGSHFFIGISSRTNSEGADQLISILKKYKLAGSKVPLTKMLHLKSGVSYLEYNNMLVTGEFNTNSNFVKYNRIIVDNDEAYAANSLWINDIVIVPEGFPKTKNKIERAGYKTMTLNISEFRKLDGGLCCLSLRF
jgi:dimethylargininase